MTDTPETPDPAFDRRVRDVFDRAMQLPAAEREACVRREAADEPLVQERVLALLAHADAPSPQVELPQPAARQSPAGDKVQSTATGELMAKLAKAPKLDTNRYELQGEIDQGGMGAILKIEDRHLNRRQQPCRERAVGQPQQQRALDPQQQPGPASRQDVSPPDRAHRFAACARRAP